MVYEGEHSSEQHPLNDPTMKDYKIRVKVNVVRSYLQQGFSEGKSEFNAVCLLPMEADTTIKFYMAWLPDDAKEHFEIVMEMGHPVYGTCRGAVLRAGKFMQRPHIFIMSKGVEDILSKKHGEILDIRVLPCSMDAESDSAPDSDNDITPIKFD